MKKTPPPPTLEQFAAYQAAWDYFSMALFDGKLKPCLLNFSRHRGSQGFFCPKRWQKGDQVVHEISLNPDLLKRPPEMSMATLGHEMCHQWQYDFGTPPRRAYHDKEWAGKMREIGLIPSDTGEPGGKETGQKMAHYIDPDGKFIKAFRKMPHQFKLPWLSGGGEGEEEKKKKPVVKKIKLTCPGCEMPIWIQAADLDRQVTCDDCGETFVTKDELEKEDEHEDE
jgi:hypothetical protein